MIVPAAATTTTTTTTATATATATAPQPPITGKSNDATPRYPHPDRTIVP
jgi:hypothetical protein